MNVKWTTWIWFCNFLQFKVLYLETEENSYDFREYSQINTGFNPVEYSILYHFSRSATKQKILE